MKIYNTLTGKKEEFVPVNSGKVTMYVCGPTVYNYFHIGNARPFIVFDTFRNYLKYKGFKVIYVQNITDVDDKIINKAKEENTTFEKVAEKYTKAYFDDIEKLKIEKPDKSPKATEEIKEMIELIKVLLEKGYAYIIKDGVYFSVEKFTDYGKLSNKKIDELKEGARVEVNDQKKNPLDFALWKFAKEGEPFWESPWGKGRPGWHIECSVMSKKYTGADTIDIHAGGIDLTFPHHENEIAQSEAATGKKFVNYWMHNGYMNVKGEKMSKSIGNIILAREVAEKYPAEIIRMFILSAHYRSPLDFTWENIEKIKQAFKDIYYTLQILKQIKKPAVKITLEESSYLKNFIDALDDDFNTPEALAVIFNLIKLAKEQIKKEFTEEIVCSLALIEKNIIEMCGVLKILPEIKEPDEKIIKLLNERNILRKEKKFIEADKIKEEIKKAGYILEDTKTRTFLIQEL